MKPVTLILAVASAVRAAFWMEDIAHQGLASFNPDKTYTVFRNVKSFGAVGDGVTDDTAAINAAISSGNRCGGTNCVGSTITPAVVYFPSGTYLVSSPIVNFYYTQIIGEPSDMPVIKGSSSFPSNANGLLDANPYLNGQLNFKSTNVFYRQLRNLIFDTTAISGTAIGVHWPSAQATSIQNCVFILSNRPEDSHTGIFMEEGSGGMISDLVFYGGEFGARFGSQQYTMRNLTFYGSRTAILQIWNWGWTYKSLSINDCDIGINMSSPDVGSVTLIDSTFTNVNTAIITSRNPGNTTGVGSLVVENIKYTNVPTVLQDLDGQPLLLGDPSGIVFDRGYARGNLYAPYGPRVFEGRNSEYFSQPSNLKLGSEYYSRSKPQYESFPASSFLSARSHGAIGDGIADDTAALNSLFQTVADAAASTNQTTQPTIAFLDAGYYRVTSTIYIPANTRLVGEALAAVILASGPAFADINKPYPVVRIGAPNEMGYVEISDLIISTQGAAAGAVLIEYNLASSSPIPTTGRSLCTNPIPSIQDHNKNVTQPSGLWDVHTRIGGFASSALQVSQCPMTPNQTVTTADPACIAAYMSMHIAPSARNLYIENSWLWTADHDIEDHNNTQITVFAGRGLLIDGASRIWLVGTAVEHHTLYQYQLVDTSDIWMGQIQTETPYYQPNPPAPGPFTSMNTDLRDPDFGFDCASIVYGNGTEPVSNGTLSLPGDPPCAMAWGLRILSSENVVVFGAGLYSFFGNYNTSCSTSERGENCQARILWVGEDFGSASARNGTVADMSTVEVYNLNTVGSVSMLTRQGADVARWSENNATFASTVAVFKF
ncbi:pectate lyase superfamily protein-domain-containing protein [Podospora appendiculata]|uniref:Pectate lyase superfamily protein-domain-containing protein n=1 Tax=Podospora appendiculata TaxID=314037 RepID=A0AAE0XLR6_9PEZI|nr:pectate lyase superfamily protein-domain-containing protein [Podospora appendiculata]